MTDRKSRRLRAGLTSTQTRTETARQADPLTAEEERVVRMIQGLGEEDDAELTFAKSVDPEVNARLQMIEAALLAEMHGQGPLAGEATEPKAKILEHLKRLEDQD